MSFYITLFTVMAVMTIMYFYSKKKENQVRNDTYKQLEEEGKEFVAALEKLDYFRYAAPSDLPEIKETIASYYDPEFEFHTYWEDDDEIMSSDYKAIFVDIEKLLANNGVSHLFQTLQPAFQKFGFLFEIIDHHASYNEANQSINEWLSVNGRKHIIVENYNEGHPNIIVPLRIVEILNKELEEQNIDERVFLAAAGQRFQILFLTPKQYMLFDKVYTEQDIKPLPPKEWSQMSYHNS